MIPEAAYVILTSSKIGPLHSVVFAILGAITERSQYGRSERAGRDCQRGSEREEVLALKSINPSSPRVWSSAAPSLRRKDTCARRVRQRKDCAEKALLLSRDDFLFMWFHLWFHHGRVSYVDVAHGEDCFQSVRGTAMTPSRTLTGSLGHSCIICGRSIRCPREKPGCYWGHDPGYARACPTATVDDLRSKRRVLWSYLTEKFQDLFRGFSVASLGQWIVIRHPRRHPH